MPLFSRMALCFVVIGAMLAGGCETYTLRGIVVQGDVPRVMTVSASDKRLQSIGIAGAQIEFVLDPSTLRPIPLGVAVTDEFGRFELSVNETGAGFLEYELGVRAKMQRFGTVWQQMPLPGSGKWLIIVMAEGGAHQSGGPEADIVEDTLKYQDQF